MRGQTFLNSKNKALKKPKIVEDLLKQTFVRMETFQICEILFKFEFRESGTPFFHDTDYITESSYFSLFNRF